MVTIRDVAKESGFSSTTVSIVLNDAPLARYIPPVTKKRIEKAAEKLGYRPNQLARGLRTGKTKTIGLIVENISNAFFATLAKSIEDEAKRYDYKVVYCSTDNDEEKARDLINMLSQRQVDGYIITPTLNLAEDIRKLQAENKPVVLIDRYFPQHNEIPAVLVDNYEGVSRGMEYLFSKGYQKIALVTIETEMAHMKDRLRAYCDVLNHHGVASQDRIVKIVPYNSDHEAALTAVTELLRDAGKTFDAVFFLTNYLGVLGIEAIKKLQIKVPQQLAVLCFDDNDIFRLYTPTISVIRQPIEAIGQRAMGVLIERLRHTGEEVYVESPPARLTADLVKRESI